VLEPLQPPFSSQEERVAYNEAWSRRLNERKAEWVENGFVAAGFRCECWQADCGARLRLSGSEWRKVRSQANRFAVAPGHISPDIETVIEEHTHFWIIDKQWARPASWLRSSPELRGAFWARELEAAAGQQNNGRAIISRAGR
jgi:hypothetical protein